MATGCSSSRRRLRDTRRVCAEHCIIGAKNSCPHSTHSIHRPIKTSPPNPSRPLRGMHCSGGRPACFPNGCPIDEVCYPSQRHLPSGEVCAVIAQSRRCGQPRSAAVAHEHKHEARPRLFSRAWLCEMRHGPGECDAEQGPQLRRFETHTLTQMHSQPSAAAAATAATGAQGGKPATIGSGWVAQVSQRTRPRR